jgi:hypothetical protein
MEGGKVGIRMLSALLPDFILELSKPENAPTQGSQDFQDILRTLELGVSGWKEARWRYECSRPGFLTSF